MNNYHMITDKISRDAPKSHPCLLSRLDNRIEVCSIQSEPKTILHVVPSELAQFDNELCTPTKTQKKPLSGKTLTTI